MNPRTDVSKAIFRKQKKTQSACWLTRQAYGLHVSPHPGSPKEAQNEVQNTHTLTPIPRTLLLRKMRQTTTDDRTKMSAQVVLFVFGRRPWAHHLVPNPLLKTRNIPDVAPTYDQELNKMCLKIDPEGPQTPKDLIKLSL